jgi:hypothetical protein
VGNFQEEQPFTFTFSEPLQTFGLTTLDLLEEMTEDNSVVILRAFDEDGNFLVQHSRTGPQGPTGLDLDWVVTSEVGIRQATLLGFVSGAASALFGIDDLLVVPLGPIENERTTWSAVKALYR